MMRIIVVKRHKQSHRRDDLWILSLEWRLPGQNKRAGRALPNTNRAG
jgi:hypothetical protein